MLELARELLITWQTGEWFIFEIYALFVWAVMLPRMLMARRFHRLLRTQRIQNYPDRDVPVSAIVTVFREDLDDLRRCLSTLKTSLVNGTRAHEMLVIVDGVEQGDTTEHMAVAREYADLVLSGNYRNKRKNLQELIGRAQHDILLLVDSDTFFEADTVSELCRPFADSKIGGTTTAQLVHQPRTLMQRMSFWFENARLNSSMAAASLYQQVACLPGRAYAVRKSIVASRMHEMVNERFNGEPCISGDDRMMTNFILRSGYKTILVPSARVTTIAPEGLLQTTRMWLRWGRSSQRYTLQSPWLLRYPVAAFIYWSDIMVTVSTAYILLVHWPLMVLNGDGGQTLMQMGVYAFLGMMMTMAVRQSVHLWQHPRYWLYLPAFVVVATYLQLLRFYALITISQVNTWGTRPGADKDGTDYKPEIRYIAATSLIPIENDFGKVVNG